MPRPWNPGIPELYDSIDIDAAAADLRELWRMSTLLGKTAE